MKYYWIKLRTDFFNQETIDFLLSQKNGCEYVVLYQMLCLNTANTNGTLANQVGEVIIPYNVEKIVRDCKYFDYDTIVVALELYKQIGLIYVEEDGNLRITDIERMVGSESATRDAIKKREQRLKKKIQEGTQKGTKCLIENRDKILDIRNKNIDIDNNSQNVFDYYQQEIGVLSPNQFELLNQYIDKYGEDKIIDAINIACNNNVKTFNYFRSVLSNDNYKKKDKDIPEWMNKENHSQKITDEELKELEKEMSIFE